MYICNFSTVGEQSKLTYDWGGVSIIYTYIVFSVSDAVCVYKT